MARSFHQKIQALMRRSGKSYHACCQALGSNGGKAAARRRRMQKAHREEMERQKLN